MQITTSPNVSVFDVDFQLDIAQAVPKAIITDISTYIGGGAANIIGINVKILDPSNLYLPYTVYPPNVDIYPGLTDTEKNLPYFNGQVKWGIYKLYTTLIDEDGTEYILTEEDGTAYKSITLCKPNSLSNATKNYGGLNLDVDPNCDYGMLIVQDGGTGFSYNGESPSETETNITITYPTDSTGATAQQVATFIPFTFPMTVSGIYTLVGTVSQTYQFTETTSVKAAYYYQNTFDVQCSYSLCKALCDYEKLVADVKNCSVKNPNEAVQQLKTLILVISELGKIAWFKQCGKKFGNILENLRKIAGFACECECAPQGIAPAPFFMQGGTLVAGNVCGDIEIALRQFMGNIQIDLSDVSYNVVASNGISEFATITPVEGVCSKTFTIDIDACALLGTVSIGCLADVNVGSPAPADGDILVFNAATGEWQAEAVSLPTLTWIALAPTSGNWSVPAGARLEYSKDFLGNVRLRGFINGIGLSNAAFYVLATLPAGYRPSTSAGEIFIVPATTGSLTAAPTPALVSILDTGQILLTVGLNGSISLSMNCEFNVN